MNLENLSPSNDLTLPISIFVSLFAIQGGPSAAVRLCLCVSVSICGVSFVITCMCSLYLLLLVPREGFLRHVTFPLYLTVLKHNLIRAFTVREQNH